MKLKSSSGLGEMIFHLLETADYIQLECGTSASEAIALKLMRYFPGKRWNYEKSEGSHYVGKMCLLFAGKSLMKLHSYMNNLIMLCLRFPDQLIQESNRCLLRGLIQLEDQRQLGENMNKSHFHAYAFTCIKLNK